MTNYLNMPNHNYVVHNYCILLLRELYSKESFSYQHLSMLERATKDPKVHEHWFIGRTNWKYTDYLNKNLLGMWKAFSLK